MRIFKYALIAIATSTLSLSSFSQIEKSLEFIPNELDFGYIREADGPVTRNVKAVNISQEPTFIISARTSCGCSDAQYDAKTIAPGDSTTVSITYDPTNRPGKFRKSAKIFTGKERISNTFHIFGNVIPSENSLENTYPVKAGDLRFSTKIINTPELKRTETRPLYIKAYNNSDSPVSVILDSDCDALEVKQQPTIVPPYEVGTLSIMLRGALIGKGTGDFKGNVRVCESESGKEILSIPVGGSVQ